MTLSRLELQTLIERLRQQVPAGSALCLDSREIQAGDVFVACPGLTVDGRDYIAHAVARGAAAVIHEEGLTPEQADVLDVVAAYSVQGLQSVLGALADAWWDHPSSALNVIAITGTNGKTTTAWWIASALRLLGHPCGLIGTLGLFGAHGERLSQASLTTPNVIEMHRVLARMRDEGATHVALEASSIGLDQGRLDQIRIHTAVLTNLTRDHLDYHGDMQQYWQAKARLFKREELSHTVINADDQTAQSFKALTSAAVSLYGLSETSDRELAWRAQAVQAQDQGLQFQICTPSNCSELIETTFAGLYNVSNYLAVAATLAGLGVPTAEVLSVLSDLPAVPGRMEPVIWDEFSASDRPRVFVDYAHTPDALERVLNAARDMAQMRGGQVWCVVGCGGQRDQGKRVLMGQVLDQHADRFVVTSDNPRNEDPQAILNDIWAGITQTDNGWQEIDRELAILNAIWAVKSEDVVVIAGKGHETWQESQGERRYFEDKQWVRLALLFYRQTAGEVPAVTLDSREIREGGFFVAVAGTRTDGHAHLASVAQQGGVAALVSRADLSIVLPQIVVDDTVHALQCLAQAWRTRFELPVIAVTGSNGKTTTKEMLTQILSHWAGEQAVLSTQGNLNNELGVPLTLLRLRSNHQVAVVELGMNHPGEIAQLAAMAQPTVGLVLNAQREHQEFMLTVDAVAQENAQVFQALDHNATAVFQDQPPYTALWQELAAHVKQRWSFGLDAQADVYATDIEMVSTGSQFVLCTASGQWPVNLPVPGQHNIYNSLASAACAFAVGVTPEIVVNALSSFQAAQGRLQLHRLPNERVLIDDTYNANPDSVRAAIDVLSQQGRPQVLILGDMGEVGEEGPAMHQEIGLYARERGLDAVWTVGAASALASEAFGQGGQHFEGHEPVNASMKQLGLASFLVKGSRFMRMECIVNNYLTDATAVVSQQEMQQEMQQETQPKQGDHHAG
ncbi:bifunctional UDP-N-acetylmuramoyl-L-alanyl-D-glutamate--2,6-diaminopimelate ligase MurE/UDP-N-acetylmuramoyl-tripeptide--D-alanyl-D-alanine ligase MurF [Orrella sp. 11846]|uniref:bifunctional UDP-N-acetylmuramoyl-L-alanyl-D-glutamate--2, 6-diaminopimelate ligase MurE/UDP-N-acetylmuramoyl-tripeptide--D-alanyl-D-alanine ligase MurF n=1 Tax=Orrella sp. 11846 TaxID=3409913 RepID=UPI003B5B11A6